MASPLEIIAEAYARRMAQPSSLEQLYGMGQLDKIPSSPKNYGGRDNPGLAGGAFSTPQAFEASVRMREAQEMAARQQNALQNVHHTRQMQAMRDADNAANPFVTPQDLGNGVRGMMIPEEYGGGVGIGGFDDRLAGTMQNHLGNIDALLPDQAEQIFQQVKELHPQNQWPSKFPTPQSLSQMDMRDAMFGGGMNPTAGAAQEFFNKNWNPQPVRDNANANFTEIAAQNEATNADLQKAMNPRIQQQKTRSMEDASALGRGYTRINDNEFIDPEGNLVTREVLFSRGVNPTRPQEGEISFGFPPMRGEDSTAGSGEAPGAPRPSTVETEQTTRFPSKQSRWEKERDAKIRSAEGGVTGTTENVLGWFGAAVDAMGIKGNDPLSWWKLIPFAGMGTEPDLKDPQALLGAQILALMGQGLSYEEALQRLQQGGMNTPILP